MLTIGEISKRTGVKVPTIRYYEQRGLIASTERSAGNQRRFDKLALSRLKFIHHARQLGFSLPAIKNLLSLQDDPDRSCAEAREIAQNHLTHIQVKITQLQALEKELTRISNGCSGKGKIGECYVLSSLADHGACLSTSH